MEVAGPLGTPLGLASSWVAIGISWSPLSGLQGVKPPVELERGLGIALQAMQDLEKRGPHKGLILSCVFRGQSSY